MRGLWVGDQIKNSDLKIKNGLHHYGLQQFFEYLPCLNAYHVKPR